MSLFLDSSSLSLEFMDFSVEYSLAKHGDGNGLCLFITYSLPSHVFQLTWRKDSIYTEMEEFKYGQPSSPLIFQHVNHKLESFCAHVSWSRSEDGYS